MNFIRGLFSSKSFVPLEEQSTPKKRVGIQNVSTVREFGYENKPSNLASRENIPVLTHERFNNYYNYETENNYNMSRNNRLPSINTQDPRYNPMNILTRKNNFRRAKLNVRKGVNRPPKAHNENHAYAIGVEAQNRELLNTRGGTRRVRHSRRRSSRRHSRRN